MKELDAADKLVLEACLKQLLIKQPDSLVKLIGFVSPPEGVDNGPLGTPAETVFTLAVGIAYLTDLFESRVLADIAANLITDISKRQVLKEILAAHVVKQALEH